LTGACGGHLSLSPESIVERPLPAARGGGYQGGTHVGQTCAMDRRQPDTGGLRFDQRPQCGRGARQPKRAAAGPCAPGGDYPDLPSLIATGELAYLVGEGETLPDPAAETGALVLESVSEAWPKSQVPACEGIDSPGSTIDWGLAADL